VTQKATVAAVRRAWPRRARTGGTPARARRDYFGDEESLAGGEAGGEAAGIDDALVFFFFEA